MTEPVTSALIGDVLKRLHAAFPRNIGASNPAMMIDVYRNGLRGLSGESVRVASDRAIQDDQYFPKVARLRELAHAWEKVNHARAEPQFEADPLWCSRCQSRATWLTRWRPVIVTDQRNKLKITPDGLSLVLESYRRLLCQCAAACDYEPTNDGEPATMPIDKLRPHDAFRIAEQTLVAKTGQQRIAAGAAR